jgi:carbonic anhydrase/acetyltransferase-like protein (isoleucine patch superfamily)
MIRDFKNHSPEIDASVFIAENAVVIGDVTIGAQSSVWYGCVLRGDVNYIRIGARTNIQDMTMIHVSRRDHPTTIEDEVTVGHSVTLHGCHVERNSLIGIGAIVLDGARIGRHALVAAGSLVSPNTVIPERSLVMGSPAKVKRELTDEEVLDLERFWRGYIELGEMFKDAG